MNIQLRLPPLTAGTPQEQLRQMYGFLRQTVEQLNWAMGQLPEAAAQQPKAVGRVAPGTAAAPNAPDAQAMATYEAPNAPDAQTLATYEAVKALIIKSATVARASYEKTRELLKQEGEFVAVSQFGTYTEDLEQRVFAQVDGIQQEFSRVESITDGISDSIRTQNSYLRFGQVGTTLDAAAATGAPGIEIGDFLQLEQDDSVSVQQRFARFTAYGLELFGSDSEIPVAYISDRQLYIELAQIRQLHMSSFVTTVRPDGTTVKRWCTDQEQEEA